jgi:N-acetylglucosamine-6-phosphate deacetylase
VLGIHLEGPYISPRKPGAQPKQWVRDYDPDEFAGWLQASGDTLRLLTMAPEQPGAGALIARARARKIVVSLGHTDAGSDAARAALDAGAAHGTHLFNQMRPFHHRNDSVVNALLFDARARVELICDGHHLAAEVVRLVLQAKGDRGVILITDAMAGADVGEGEYELGGLPVRVAGGRATLADGTLAGSVLTLERAAANVRVWTGADWPALARLVSTNAADQMGWNHKGRLSPGADADFVLVDDDWTVHATYVAGRCVFLRRGPAGSADATATASSSGNARRPV